MYEGLPPMFDGCVVGLVVSCGRLLGAYRLLDETIVGRPRERGKGP